MSDYSISWGYIVSRMESLYGISPDNKEKVALGEIENRIAYIWAEKFDWKRMVYKEEFGEQMKEQE